MGKSNAYGSRFILTTFVQWEQTNFTLYEYDCDYDGSKKGLIWNGTKVGYTWETPGYNGTLEYSEPNTPLAYNWDNYTFTMMRPVYTWNKAAYKTSVAVIQNPVTKERMLVGNDWTLSFVSDKFSALVHSIPYEMFFACVDPFNAGLIGTSIGLNLAIPGSHSTVTYDNATYASPFLADFYSWVTVRYDSTDAVGLLASLSNEISASGPIIVSRSIGGRSYSARFELVAVAWDVPWVSIQFLNMDEVTAALRQSSTKTEIIIFTIMAAMVLIGTVFANGLAWQIIAVVQQINTLKDLRFQEVLDREGVRSPSFVYELSQLQTSFHDLVTVFSQHLKVKNELVGTKRAFNPSQSTSGDAAKTASLTRPLLADQR
ncbi:hypothetical protein HK101_011945 [Irineochytrium annulatum]|nr:hypothetical protein HK101_011945 [Irineochytrium annulatum]